MITDPAGGGIRSHGDGRVTLSGVVPSLCRAVDGRIRALATEGGARELQGPALLDRSVLERAGYFDAFPDAATTVLDGTYALQPAACYHCYAELAGTCVDRTVLTVAGRCYRRGEAAFTGMTRLWEFTMREVVLLGSPDWVQAERAAWIERAVQLARGLGLDVATEAATDSFLGPAGRGRRLIQQLKELKVEITAAAGEERVALASVNLHETFFATRFDLRGADGRPAYSACAAFGLERWAAAVLAQRGEAFAARLAAGG